jgi:uncharacterized membrane protein
MSYKEQILPSPRLFIQGTNACVTQKQFKIELFFDCFCNADWAAKEVYYLSGESGRWS